MKNLIIKIKEYLVNRKVKNDHNRFVTAVTTWRKKYGQIKEKP